MRKILKEENVKVEIPDAWYEKRWRFGYSAGGDLGDNLIWWMSWAAPASSFLMKTCGAIRWSRIIHYEPGSTFKLG